VGISAVIGLAMPRDLPVAGVPTHAIEAERYLPKASPEAPVISVVPAGRGELAWARFESPSPEPADTGIAAAADFIASLAEGAQICGEAAELLVGKVPPEMIVGRQPPTRRPSSLISLAQRQFAEHGPTDPTRLRPIYARPPSITAPNPLS
jgi:tRNA A37 threonylcarbamoyladenosine modification protein TsaB